VLRHTSGNPTHLTSKPRLSTNCKVAYKGWYPKYVRTFMQKKWGPYPQKKYFDQSNGTWFAPDEVVPGWKEAMQLMQEGDVWRIYTPSNLGYKDNRVRVFEIKLLCIKKCTRRKEKKRLPNPHQKLNRMGSKGKRGVTAGNLTEWRQLAHDTSAPASSLGLVFTSPTITDNSVKWDNAYYKDIDVAIAAHPSVVHCGHYPGVKSEEHPFGIIDYPERCKTIPMVLMVTPETSWWPYQGTLYCTHTVLILYSYFMVAVPRSETSGLGEDA
jgi:hypothetical protein